MLLEQAQKAWRPLKSSNTSCVLNWSLHMKPMNEPTPLWIRPTWTTFLEETQKRRWQRNPLWELLTTLASPTHNLLTVEQQVVVCGAPTSETEMQESLPTKAWLWSPSAPSEVRMWGIIEASCGSKCLLVKYVSYRCHVMNAYCISRSQIFI